MPLALICSIAHSDCFSCLDRGNYVNQWWRNNGGIQPNEMKGSERVKMKGKEKKRRGKEEGWKNGKGKKGGKESKGTIWKGERKRKRRKWRQERKEREGV